MICAQFQFSSIDSYSAFNSGHSHKAASKKSGYGCRFRPLMRRQWQEKNSPRQHEETLRGKRLKREPIFLWATPDGAIMSHYFKTGTMPQM